MQRLGLCNLTTEGLGSIPGWELRSHEPHGAAKIKKEKKKSASHLLFGQLVHHHCPISQREEGNCRDLAQASAPPAQVGPLYSDTPFPAGSAGLWHRPVPCGRGVPCGPAHPGLSPLCPPFRENEQDILAVLPSTDDYFLLRWLRGEHGR